jgi:predicted dehydrogenase
MEKHTRLGMGLIGPGFIATHHINAVRRLGNVDVIGVAGKDMEESQGKAQEYGVERSYAHYEDLIADPDIHVVHNTTPSHLHFPVSMAVLKAGKHLLSEKPLALDAKQCKLLRDAASEAGVINAVNFNYRGNPLVQQARAMTASGDIGPVFFIHGHYLQDWMTNENVYSWRSDPKQGGASCALADIGSHWCNLAEHVSGQRITSVLADLTTVVKTRYTTGNTAGAFQQGATGERRAVEMVSEDLASVLLRFGNGTKGCLNVGQILPGHKNELVLEQNGRTGSLRWKQEEQNELWIGREDKPNILLGKNPSLMLPEARPYAHLPGGHQEGWTDAFFNVVADVYRWVRAGVNTTPRPATVCTFADATHISQIVEAMLRSNSLGGVWQNVETD